MLGRIFAVLLVLVALAVAALWWDSRDLAPETVEAAYMTPDDRFVQVDDVRVRVREQGPAGAPPLLLIHGFTQTLENWDGWASALDDEFRVIRYDLTGHGLTGPHPDERYAPTDRAAFIGDVMDALGLESAAIAGSSLGGLAAWRFAAAAPDRVDALILVDPGAFSINGVTEEAVAVPPMVAYILRAAPGWGVRAFAAAAVADEETLTEEGLARLRAMWRRRGNGQAMVRALEQFTLPDPEADLARITAPTLILWGGQDALIPVDHGERMADLIPNATLIVHDDLGHTPHDEAPARTAQDVRAFLAAR